MQTVLLIRIIKVSQKKFFFFLEFEEGLLKIDFNFFSCWKVKGVDG